MNKVLYIILISLFSLTIFSCSSSDDSKTTTSSVSFVAVGNSGTLLTSSDGITWTSRTSGTTKSLNGITYANNTFITVGGSGTIMTSSDGTSWTPKTSGTTKSLNGITYANSKFIVVSGDWDANTGTIMNSADGNTLEYLRNNKLSL